ncbi:M1 family metallopeptidase [Mucilaginibacter sp. X4EP1]|uniref:M1 family metallopeptidase n=1 Tax=Mucilaginibacter sp. X4EP1 TaxID=2723092 RepID=UPI00216A6103|nr:M1 family metallopeptidase [Mucilaginibacter sp. X4EP1]MCS3811774.1 aminopeptidase N [Mucilaginibacter sp. X4EP1]
MKKTLSFLFICFCVLSVKAQAQFPAIDVQHYTFNLRLNDQNDTIKGRATVSIQFLKDVSAFQLNLVKTKSDGKGMLVSAVKEDGKTVAFVQDTDVVNINSIAKANSVHSYTINYQGIPADGLIISTNQYGHRTFFGDNWPNRAHNWLPCADYPADKATVDFEVTAPNHYQVVSNGLKVEEKNIAGNLKYTHWKESVPLPTKVMVIGVADFAIDHTGNVGPTAVYTYVFPESKKAGFKSYAVAKEILPFYISKVGPYAYEKLANVQSKTIFGGMENAGAIFYFENSVTSKGIEELMAHEIAHQWFGDGASEKSFAHLWLSEGFATYMTNLYLENKYGSDTLKKREKADRVIVLKFEKRRLTPVVDTAVKDDYMQLLNANSYQKGGWVLHMLRRKLGDTTFWKGIRNYYAQYNGANANTDDLRRVMEQTSGQNLEHFFKQWLYTAGHPQLNINWKYDADKGVINISINQNQDVLYDFPLQIAVNGELHNIDIKEKNTIVQFAATANPVVVVDPDVNLLAEFNVNQ